MNAKNYFKNINNFSCRLLSLWFISKQASETKMRLDTYYQGAWTNFIILCLQDSIGFKKKIKYDLVQNFLIYIYFFVKLHHEIRFYKSPRTQKTMIFNKNKILLIPRAQLFTTLKTDFCQDINGGFVFSRCLNGLCPWRNCSFKSKTSFKEMLLINAKRLFFVLSEICLHWSR